jgi:outer membrane lipoprotein LolB
VDGRIAVNQGSQGWQASVRWREQPERYAIDLIGPLGQGRALIEGTPAGVRMQTERDVLSAAEPDSLLAQATGMQVPISGLRYWIRGLPDPSQPSRPSVDERGRLRRLEQNGWMIEYPNYIQVNGLELPKRIHAQQGELEVKLFIQTWTL